MAEDNLDLAVGDVFIINGAPNSIFEISPGKDLDGNKVPVAFYRPMFPVPNTNPITRSIPVKHFGRVNQRKPISKKEVAELLKRLSEDITVSELVDLQDANSLVKLNNLEDKVELVKKLWHEKINKVTGFAYNKSHILNMAISHLKEEIAIVMNIKPELAEKKILKALDKQVSK